MARRRILRGRPLLVATTGLMLACSGGKNGPEVVGNLMPPQRFSGEVCIDTIPADAVVVVNGAPHTERCQTIETAGTFEVEASAPGHGVYRETHDLSPHVDLKIKLVPEPAPPPVGNLMPPPDIERPPPMSAPR